MTDPTRALEAVYWQRRRVKLFIAAAAFTILSGYCAWRGFAGWRDETRTAALVAATTTQLDREAQTLLRGTFEERANTALRNWGLAALFMLGVAGLLLLAARDARHNAWAALGCCRRCGYPLYGLPEPRCPECGQWAEGGSAPPPPNQD